MKNLHTPKKKVAPKTSSRLYKQEGKIGLFQIQFPYHGLVLMYGYIKATYGNVYAFGRNNYFTVLLVEENMVKVAAEVIRRSRGGVLPAEWRRDFYKAGRDITKLSRRISETDLTALPLSTLRSLYRKLYNAAMRMWAPSIFIDVFDAGFDREEIERIGKDHSLDFDEVAVLLTPEKPSYVAEWEAAISKFKAGNIKVGDVRREFFWYATNYSEFSEVDETFVATEVKRSGTRHPFVSPTKAKREILKAHDLSSNPLTLFAELAVWRDDRKRFNYTSLYGFMRIVREVARRNDIGAALVNALLHTEVDDFFAGKVSADTLKTHLTEGVYFEATPEHSIRYLTGEKALERWKEVNATATVPGGTASVTGMVASRGKVTGTVAIIADPFSDRARAMKEGEILVTSMTRPEFLPLMKKAGAIVTDEGGISCHAAIVARELNKPCIIGTRNATRILKEGDEVEVDAEQGMVTIISIQ